MLMPTKGTGHEDPEREHRRPTCPRRVIPSKCPRRTTGAADESGEGLSVRTRGFETLRAPAGQGARHDGYGRHAGQDDDHSFYPTSGLMGSRPGLSRS
jgi:hypothetical protein